jgi:DNA polymerase (family 10)
LTYGPGANTGFYTGDQLGSREDHISMETLKRYLRLIELPGPEEQAGQSVSPADRKSSSVENNPSTLADWILSLWRSSPSIDPRILGDFHVHTIHSDGMDSVETVISAAHGLGYRWIGLADHAPGGDHPYRLTVQRFQSRLDASQAAAARYPVRIRQALEADLVETGMQEIPSAIIDRLDYILISTHDPGLERSDKTLRALEAAFSLDLVKGYAHPFWMLDFHDYKQFIAEAVALAVAKDIAVELNFYPDSIRANGFLLREVRRLGGSIMLSTDAHHVNALPLMRFASAFLQGDENVDVLNFRESPF